MSEEQTLAEELRRAREGRGESLAQVHQRTGIGAKVLQALEEGDLEAIEVVYMRLAVVHYAGYLGLDGNALAQRLGGREAMRRPPARTLSEGGGPVFGGGLLKWVLAGAIAVLLAVVYLLNRGGGDPAPQAAPVPEAPASREAPSVWDQADVVSTEPVDSAEPVEAGRPAEAGPGDRAAPDISGTALEGGPDESAAADDLAEAGPPEEVPAAGSTEAAPAADTPAIAPMVLQAEVLDTVWVQVGWDGADSVMETIVGGEQRTWTAERFFEVHVGRSRNIRFRFQGQLLGEGLLDKPDRTLRFRVSAGGYQLLGPDLQPIAPVTEFKPERTESSQPGVR